MTCNVKAQLKIHRCIGTATQREERLELQKLQISWPREVGIPKQKGIRGQRNSGKKLLREEVSERRGT